MCPTSQVAISKTSFSFFPIPTSPPLPHSFPKGMDNNFFLIIFSQQAVPQQIFLCRCFVLDTLSPFTSHLHLLFILTHLPMAPSQNSGFVGFLFFLFSPTRLLKALTDKAEGNGPWWFGSSVQDRWRSFGSFHNTTQVAFLEKLLS